MFHAPLNPPENRPALTTTTPFQDTPGIHQTLLNKAGFDVVRERGPLSEDRMLASAGNFDALIGGDDDISRSVLEKSLCSSGSLGYGVGLDKLDLSAAQELGVPVFSTPGVNHTTVAEYTFALMLAATRNIVPQANHVAQGNWKRLTGYELLGNKTLAIVGLGRIGQEVAIRAKAFGMKLLGFGNYWEDRFTTELGIERRTDLEQLLREADILTLHTDSTAETRHLINATNIRYLKPNTILINCARGEVVETSALVEALKSGRTAAYAAHVLDVEPPPLGLSAGRVAERRYHS